MSAFNLELSLCNTLCYTLEIKRNKTQHLPFTYLIVEPAYWIIGSVLVFLCAQLQQ